jgi:GTP-binding protein HflX
VQRVLHEIGAAGVAQVLVFNKIDALDADRTPAALRDSFELEGVQVPRVFVSARTAAGLPLLRAELVRAVTDDSARKAAQHPENVPFHETPA